MSLGLILYGLALILLIYIIINIAQTKKFEIGDAIATLGIVVTILLALNVTPPITIPPATTLANTPSQPTPIYPMLLDEQFDNPQYNDSLNRNLWVITGETDPKIVSHAQSNGVLVSIMQPLKSKDSEIHSIQQWPIKEMNYSEWRVKFDNSVSGDYASLALGLATELDDRFLCDVKFHESGKGLNCSIWEHGKDAANISRGNTPLQSNTWYILRISIVNNPLEFRVYLDGQLIASYVVKNPEPWESNQIHIYSSLSGVNIKTALTTRIDYAVVTGQ